MFEKIIFGFIAVIAIYQGYQYLDKQQKLNEADKIVAIQKAKGDALIKQADKLIEKIDRNKMCKSIENLARTIMTNRQKGVSMSDMMVSTGTNDIGIELIKLAYNKPRYTTEEYKQTSIEKFANKAALVCYSRK